MLPIFRDAVPTALDLLVHFVRQYYLVGHIVFDEHSPTPRTSGSFMALLLGCSLDGSPKRGFRRHRRYCARGMSPRKRVVERRLLHISEYGSKHECCMGCGGESGAGDELTERSRRVIAERTRVTRCCMEQRREYTR